MLPVLSIHGLVHDSGSRYDGILHVPSLLRHLLGSSYYELDPENRRKPQEVPFVMWGALVFLAIISCLCGLIPFGHFISATGQSYDIHIDMSVATTSVIVAIIGIGLATYMYAPKKTPLADGFG